MRPQNGLADFFTRDPHWIEFHYQDKGTHKAQARVQKGGGAPPTASV
jgi:hypothetical protein